MKKIILAAGVFLIILIACIVFIPGIRNFIGRSGLGARFFSSASGRGDALSQQPEAGSQQPVKKFPEPGIDRIKNDLLGKQIPGWSFDRITEFKQAAITSIARTEVRIDFRLDLHMLPYNAKDGIYYDAQIFATYLAGDEGWQIDKVEEIFLSYDIRVPAGRWITLNAPPRCSLQPDSKNKLVWTSPAWDYEISTGPGVGDVTLPPADSYQVKSKGKHAVTVKVTFRPGG